MIHWPLIFIAGLVVSSSYGFRPQQSIVLGKVDEKKAWVYLCGLTSEWNGPQELDNRKILKNIADEEHIKIMAIKPKHRSADFGGKLCWPHNTPKQVQETYREILAQIPDEKIAGFVGFSNGGFFLNKLAEQIKLNKPVISIGSGGFINSPSATNDLYLIVGKKDTHHYSNALNYYQQAKSYGTLHVELIEHEDEHIIPEMILKELIHKLKANAKDNISLKSGPLQVF